MSGELLGVRLPVEGRGLAGAWLQGGRGVASVGRAWLQAGRAWPQRSATPRRSCLQSEATRRAAAQRGARGFRTGRGTACGNRPRAERAPAARPQGSGGEDGGNDGLKRSRLSMRA